MKFKFSEIETKKDNFFTLDSKEKIKISGEDGRRMLLKIGSMSKSDVSKLEASMSKDIEGFLEGIGKLE